MLEDGQFSLQLQKFLFVLRRAGDFPSEYSRDADIEGSSQIVNFGLCDRDGMEDQFPFPLNGIFEERHGFLWLGAFNIGSGDTILVRPGKVM